MNQESGSRKLKRRNILKAVGAAGVSVAGVSGPVGASEEFDDLAGLDQPGETSCDTDRNSDENLPFDTDGAYGGWGGHEHHGTEPGLDHYPIVFAHGNSRDACDFDEHAEYFIERGFGGDALWSITFRETGSTHGMMRDQLEDFIEKIGEETGVNTVSVVGHSLGVTGIRHWMDDFDRFDRVETFVGLAGANHGTETCGVLCESGPGNARPCNFIAIPCADTPGEPLFELNTPNETPGDVEYYTIRGTADAFFTTRMDSPELEGAVENVVLDGATHDEVRTSNESKQLMFQWLSEELPPDARRQDG
jgi:triacylglycerol lipase